MRKYTKILTLVISVLMVTALLCGCGGKAKEPKPHADTQDKAVSETKSEAELMEALVGTWQMPVSQSESTAQTLLESIDLSPDEIACVDLTTLNLVKIVKFTTEKTYLFGYDPEATKACARTFFEGAFQAMYENRTSLNQLYDRDFASTSKEEFLQFYAELYGAADFPGLLDSLSANCYNYDMVAEPLEEGTYALREGVIEMTVLGQSTSDLLEYTLGSGVLMLTYVDGTEVYSRSN